MLKLSYQSLAESLLKLIIVLLRSDVWYALEFVLFSTFFCANVWFVRWDGAKRSTEVRDKLQRLIQKIKRWDDKRVNIHCASDE